MMPDNIVSSGITIWQNCDRSRSAQVEEPKSGDAGIPYLVSLDAADDVKCTEYRLSNLQ